MINIGAIQRAIVCAVICLTLGSCAGVVAILEFGSSIEAQDDRYGRIRVFIDNQTNEALVLFV
ncbi:MAG: hypothetical protein LBC46_03550, partial [Treponema sp.]|nr:hypothetical protein [Treponema sp.]